MVAIMQDIAVLHLSLLDERDVSTAPSLSASGTSGLSANAVCILVLGATGFGILLLAFSTCYVRKKLFEEYQERELRGRDLDQAEHKAWISTRLPDAAYRQQVRDNANICLQLMIQKHRSIDSAAAFDEPFNNHRTLKLSTETHHD